MINSGEVSCIITKSSWFELSYHQFYKSKDEYLTNLCSKDDHNTAPTREQLLIYVTRQWTSMKHQMISEVCIVIGIFDGQILKTQLPTEVK